MFVSVAETVLVPFLEAVNISAFSGVFSLHDKENNSDEIAAQAIPINRFFFIIN